MVPPCQPCVPLPRGWLHAACGTRVAHCNQVAPYFRVPLPPRYSLGPTVPPFFGSQKLRPISMFNVRFSVSQESVLMTGVCPFRLLIELCSLLLSQGPSLCSLLLSQECPSLCSLLVSQESVLRYRFLIGHFKNKTAFMNKETDCLKVYYSFNRILYVRISRTRILWALKILARHFSTNQSRSPHKNQFASSLRGYLLASFSSPTTPFFSSPYTYYIHTPCRSCLLSLNLTWIVSTLLSMTKSVISSTRQTVKWQPLRFGTRKMPPPCPAFLLQ